MFILKFEEMLKTTVIMVFKKKMFLASHDVNCSACLNCVHHICEYQKLLWQVHQEL